MDGCLNVNNPLWGSITRQGSRTLAGAAADLHARMHSDQRQRTYRSTSVDGVAGTAAPANWSINSTPAPGLDRSTDSITVAQRRRAGPTWASLRRPSVSRGITLSDIHLAPRLWRTPVLRVRRCSRGERERTAVYVVLVDTGTYTGSTGTDMLGTTLQYGSITRACARRSRLPTGSCQDVLSATHTTTLGTSRSPEGLALRARAALDVHALQ